MATSFDDPVTEEEVRAAAERLDAQVSLETPPADPLEPPPADPAQATEPVPAGSPAAEPPAAGSFLEVGGKRYTEDDIIELQRGSLLQSDYTRKTQMLQEERRLLEERAAIQSEREALLESFGRGNRGADEDQSGVEVDQIDAPAASPEVKALTDRLSRLESEIAEQRQLRHDETVWSSYQSAVGELHERYQVPKELRRYVEAEVLRIDPAVADGNGTPLPKEQLRESVSKAYLEAYRPLHGFVKQTRTAPAGQPTTTGRIPPPPGGGPAPRVSAPTGQPQKPSWEGNEAALEFMARMGQEPQAPEG
jgi:hypothetical protein